MDIESPREDQSQGLGFWHPTMRPDTHQPLDLKLKKEAQDQIKPQQREGEALWALSPSETPVPSAESYSSHLAQNTLPLNNVSPATLNADVLSSQLQNHHDAILPPNNGPHQEEGGHHATFKSPDRPGGDAKIVPVNTVFGLTRHDDTGSLDDIRFPEYPSFQNDEAGGNTTVTSDKLEPGHSSLKAQDQFDKAWNLGENLQGVGKNGTSNRTNSFPEVPPLHEARPLVPHPLSISQAEHIMDEENEVEELGEIYARNEVSYPAESQYDFGLDEGFFSNAGENRKLAPQSPADDEVRFEEGLPLMPLKPREEGLDGTIAQNQDPTDSSTGWLTMDEGDFIHTRSATSQDDSAIFRPQPPDRKSTVQVLDSLKFPPYGETHEGLENVKGRSSEAKSTGGGSTGPVSTIQADVFPEKQLKEEAIDLEPPTIAWNPPEEDLAAIWAAALGDDELLEDEDLSMDPSKFFEEDGEGFLEETRSQVGNEDSLPQPPSSRSQPVLRDDGKLQGLGHSGTEFNYQGSVSQTRYMPASSQNQVNSRPGDFAHQETTGASRSLSAPQSMVNAPIQQQFSSNPSHFSRPTMPAPAQSFSDKSKGGYTSPYDLPMDLTRPKKRTHLQQMQTASDVRALSRPPPPPRTSSMFSGGISSAVESLPPSSTLPPGKMPTPSLDSRTPSANISTPAPGSKLSTGGFFEELPSSKPRPSSSRAKTSGISVPPSQLPAAPFQPEPPRQHSFPQPPISNSPGISQGYKLLPAERMGLFSHTPHNEPLSQAPVVNSRYSPAPLSNVNGPPNRNRYASSPSNGPRPPPTSQSIPFQPRTSSPLAQNHTVPQNFQPTSQNEGQNDSAYQNSRSQLPPSQNPATNSKSRQSEPESVYLDQQSPVEPSTIPSLASARSSQLSPPSISNAYVPTSKLSSKPYSVSRATSHYTLPNRGPPIKHNFELPNSGQGLINSLDPAFAPPRRSQTQSPSAMRSKQTLPTRVQEPYHRPASTNHQTSLSHSEAPVTSVPPQNFARGKSFSQRFEYIRPVDGREYDSLERWKGCPIFNFGFGGTIVSTFPKQIPRYSAGQTMPMIKCSPGEVKLHAGRTVSLEESVTSFPGPLKTKSKKKEVLDWLQTRILRLESTQVPGTINAIFPDPHNRLEEKILLWKILRILVEHDGVLDGNAAALTAVRSVLLPELTPGNHDHSSFQPSNQALIGISRHDGSLKTSEPVHIEGIEALRKILLQGEREKAVWHAVDQRLWPHAMLLASTLDTKVWKQVIQEFILQEVKTCAKNTESMASLYQILAGNWEESVDELVAPSARAGLQMVSKVAGASPAKNALDGLNRWRETLILTLSNRSKDDWNALVALGRLLSSYGRTEAAHVCFIFAKSPGVFGGADDPQVCVALLGADHIRNPLDYDRDIDSILLTEIYDFARTVLAPATVATFSSHLQSYKLYHAMILAEYGYRSEAQQYCDSIAGVLKSTTKPSPYFHGLLFGALEDLTERLRQAPTDDSASWRPSIDKVSGSVWARLGTFIAGDETDNGSVASGKGLEQDLSGPFARVIGDMPVVSPPVSSSELYGGYPVGNVASAPAAGPNIPSSRYAPVGQYTPRSSLEQTRTWSSQETRQEFQSENHTPLMPHQQFQSRNSSFTGVSQDSPPNSYKPMAEQTAYRAQSRNYLPTPPARPDYIPYAPPEEVLPSPLDYESYRPTPPPKDEPVQETHHISESQSTNTYEAPSSNHNGISSYEPPATSSYEPYEPPSYNPDFSNGGESPVEAKPKKKSFMDDDDEEFDSRAAAALKAEKAKKDRETDEAFRKAAEADGMFHPVIYLS